MQLSRKTRGRGKRTGTYPGSRSSGDI